jgi:uncharacterized protein (TIGR00255 family)
MKSMTGYGSGNVASTAGRLIVEVRSVNARFLELKVSLPRELQSLEAEVRATVQDAITRGRVDVAVKREMVKRELRVEADVDLIRAHLRAWQQIQRQLKLPGKIDVELLARTGLVAVRTLDQPIDLRKENAALKRALAGALAAHGRERAREGAHLQRDMRARLRSLERLRQTCAREAAKLAPLLSERLSTRVATLLGNTSLDPARLAQEIALVVDRGDVTEETTRLDSHLKALAALLDDAEPIGKRVEFLLQEILREVNTIGSKANHLPITQAVLAAKAEVEKLREQVANVE